MVANRPRVNREVAQVALVSLMCAFGALGLKSAFVSWGFAPVVVIAAIAGAAVPFAAHWFKIEFPFSSLISVSYTHLTLPTICSV